MSIAPVNRAFPLAAILVTLIMFLSSVPSEYMAAILSYSSSEKVETEIFDFDETIYHESEHELFASHKTLFTTPQFPYSADYYPCLTIQEVASNWDCRDLDGNPGGLTGHYLEHDRYSFNVAMVYQYKIEYSGSIEIETRTTWSYGSAPQTTMTVIDSSETMIVSAKASFRLNLYRHYVGPNGYDFQLRNQLSFDYPALSTSDIDGDNSYVRVGGQTFYKWDQYSVFDSESNQQDELGSKHTLAGSKTVAEIDLLELAANHAPSATIRSIATTFSYFLEISFQINLNLKAEMTNYAQLFLGMSSVQSMRNNFNHPSQKAAYNCALTSSNNCIKMVSGQGTQINGFLGFYHQIKTSESYSADIVIGPADTWEARELWSLFTNQQTWSRSLSEGHFATASTGYQFSETSETISIDLSGYVPAPPNNAPTISLQNSQIQGSNLFVNTGDSVQLSVSAYDADGDSMSGSLSWGDGTAIDWSASIPNSVSHTYTSTGIYYVGAEVYDDVASSYSAPLTVIVTPDTSALENLDIVSSDSMIDEGDTINFTLSSSNPTANLEFVFDDDQGNSETIQPPAGELSSVQRQITYDIPGDYTPNIQAYDSQSNLLGYQEISLRVLPDFGNGSVDPSLFQLIGDGVLIVIDDNGYELSTAERTADYQNSNTSSMTLLQAVAKVATIRNKSMEIHIVGDTNLDGVVDSPGANGPGLNILRHYSTVVWTTGADYEPLTEFDEAVLRTYVGSAGSLIMFSQDYLWGADPGQTNWAPGTFAYDVLGIGSSDQDIGEPSGDLQISDGEGMKYGAYIPLAGIETIGINPLEANAYQDHISSDFSVTMPCEFQGFESSSLSNSKSDFVDCNTGAQKGQGSISWTTWSSHWMRDCTYYASGSCSYKSAPATHNNGKQMRAYVPASSTSQQLSFYYMVSTQANYDKLQFLVDGNIVQQWSGSQSWTQYQYTLPASSSQTTLEWWYVKDGSISSGADTVWIDHFVICCDVGVANRPDTLEVLSDGTSNFGVAHHAFADADNDGQNDTTTHTAFITLDPVQFEYKYDLETTLLQLIDWSSNRNPLGSTPGGGIHAPERANWLPVGIDMIHPSAHSQGGEQWYNVRLFDGQKISIDSSIYNRPQQNEDAISHYDIDSLKIFDPDGVPTVGTATTSDEWVLEYIASSNGVYQIRIELIYTGTQEILPSPWYQLSVETLSDNFSPTLILDGSSIHDALSPQNWTLSTGDDDYSSTRYSLGTLQSGDVYGLTFISADYSSSHSLEYILIDNELYSRLWNQSVNGDNDNDGDGIPNDIDEDDDDDGVLDASDPTPYDRDDDGINDAEDEDDDGNGIADIDEALFESGEFNLSSGKSHTQLIQISGTKEIGYWILNADSYNHPLLGSFGFDIEFWSMPPEDASDLVTGAYQISEDLEQSFWVSSVVDASDTFTVDVAWDEGMILQFKADSGLLGATAEISCGNGPFAIVELGMKTVLEIDCQEPHSTGNIVISSDSQLMEYSLLYERKEATVEVVMDYPMFGTNQVESGSDFWNLVSIAPGQMIDINGDGAGAIKFYNREGQVVATESVNSSTGSINIPATAKKFSVIDAGDYQFIVSNPNRQYTSVKSPEPVLIGEIVTIDITSTQRHDLSAMLNSERIYYMWNLSSPSLEFDVTSHQNITQIEEANVTHSEFFPSVSTDSTTIISVNSSGLGIGQHVLTISVESSWTGIIYYDVTLVVNDLPNTPPQLSGTENFTLEVNTTSSWIYYATDSDGDELTFSLINSPSNILLEAEFDVAIGSGIVTLSWQPQTEGIYSVTLVASDGIDTNVFSTIIDVVPVLAPPVDDVYGCMDATANNFNSTATIDDDSCEYSDDEINKIDEIDENNTSQEPQSNISNEGGNDKGGSEEESNQKSDYSTSGGVMIGSVIGLIVLIVIVSMLVIRRPGEDDISFDQEMPSMQQWDDPQPLPIAPIPGMMAAPPPPVAPIQQLSMGGGFGPMPSMTGIPDGAGYEWLDFHGKKYWRIAGSFSNWTLHQ